MLSLEEAREKLLGSINLLDAERVPIFDAPGRFAAEPISSLIDLPRFDNSAMDGYVVRSDDLKDASAEAPVSLRQIARIGAGEVFLGTVSPSECARIFTGSFLPRGADAVVMQEDVVAIEGGRVQFREPIKPLENVRLRGEDICAGTIIANPGDEITATRASLAAATGHAEVSARTRPRVALLSTGSELLEPGQTLAEGKIYESNRILIASLLRAIHCEPAISPLVPDDLDTTIAALKGAFAHNDFVVTTGGVSVGEFDFVKEAFEELGGKLEFWKVALRPGKPFVHGRLGAKHLFGLPGNPVSALVTFLLLVRPAVLKAVGARDLDLPRLPGELSESLVNRGDRRHFVRARWKNGKIEIAGPQSSHMLGSLGSANCLLDIPAGAQFQPGTILPAHLWQLPTN